MKKKRMITDKEIIAEIDDILAHPDKVSEDEAERDAYFTDPSNAEEAEAMLARMELVEVMYKARQEAGLTQQELAGKLGTKQTYIAALEKGKKTLPFPLLQSMPLPAGKKLLLQCSEKSLL